MCTRVRLHLQLGVISQGAVFHALRKPEELALAVASPPSRQIGRVAVRDVEDSAVGVHFTPDWDRDCVSGDESAVLGICAGDFRVSGSGGGGCSGDGEEEEEEEEEVVAERSHGIGRFGVRRVWS